MFAYVAERAGELSKAAELEGCDFDTNVMKAYELQVCIPIFFLAISNFRQLPKLRRLLLPELLK